MMDLNNAVSDDVRQARWWPLLIVALQAILLTAAVWQSRGNLNPDGIAYMRIAGYYASGQTDLMVSGYWGPLISWLMVPLLIAGMTQLSAAWTVMALSAVVFLLGSMSLFSRLRLPRSGQIIGSALVALASIGWCTDRITPDLLVTGCMMFATGQIVSADWVNSPRRQAIAGVCWALAFFAKAVAFPLALLFTAGLALIQFTTRSCRLAPAARALAMTLAVFLVCALPWLTVLSFKFHGPTFSVTPAVTHGGVGPGVAPGYIRMTTFEVFHTPETGRLSSLEDPTSLPYPKWSRFESRANFMHQLRLLKGNLEFELATLRSFDVFGVGLLGVLIAAALVWPANRRSLSAEPWQWTFLAVGAVLLIYLPDFGASKRYFYPTYPFLLAAAIGLASWVSTRLSLPTRATRRTLFVLVAASFSLGTLPEAVRATLDGGTAGQEAVAQARSLSQRLRMARVVGPIAGEAPLGVYLSYVLSQPYHGNNPAATVEDFERLKGSVKLLLIDARNPVAQDLRMNSAFRELTAELYATSESNHPGLAIFEVL